MKNVVFRRLVTFWVTAAVSLALAAPAQAVKRPYLSAGTAQFISATDYIGSGSAAHLGLYDELGSAQFSPTADPAVLRVDAWSIYTAANGDELYAVLQGQLNAVTGAVTATVTYIGGTGRFAHASGSAALCGQLLPEGRIEVVVEGVIDY